MSLKRFNRARIPRNFEFQGFEKTDRPADFKPRELGRIALWLQSEGYEFKGGVRGNSEHVPEQGSTAMQLYSLLDMSYRFPDPEHSNGHIMGPHATELEDGSLEVAVKESSMGVWQRPEETAE